MPHILLIDDDAREHHLVDFFLKAHFDDAYELNATSELEEALTWLTRFRYDCILLDNRLRPAVDARHNAPIVRRAAPETPIYVISVCVDDEPWMRDTRFGFDRVIDKFALKDEISRGLVA